MKTISLNLLLLMQLYSLSFFGQQKHFTFYFASGKKQAVNLEAFKDSLAKWTAFNEISVLKISGHADNVGSAASNLRLSSRRALTVQKMIQELTAQLENAIFVAKGEADPAYNNASQEGRAKNRRVEAFFLLKPKHFETEKISSLEIQTATNACEERDTIITLPEGTEIEIKGCSLEGLSLKDIKVEAQEFLTRDQMILNDMYTQTSDGTCLSTGGMLSYKITGPDGKAISLKPDKNIIIRVPKISKDTAFNLYQMAENGKGENGGWNKRNDTVKYLREKQKFEVLSKSPVFSMNLDFVPVLGPALSKARKDKVKTRVVRNAKTYINGESSVLKLNRYKPRKFKYQNCNCIPESDQYATVIAKKNNQIYYCHKPLVELKKKRFLGKTFIVRKKDYEVLASKKELDRRLKIDLASK